jgi:hypothetical protein
MIVLTLLLALATLAALTVTSDAFNARSAAPSCARLARDRKTDLTHATKIFHVQANHARTPSHLDPAGPEGGPIASVHAPKAHDARLTHAVR